MTKKRYRTLACAIAVATSFAALHSSTVYAETPENAAEAVVTEAAADETPADAPAAAATTAEVPAAASADANTTAEVPAVAPVPAATTAEAPADVATTTTTAVPADAAETAASAPEAAAPEATAPPADAAAPAVADPRDTWATTRPNDKDVADQLKVYEGQTIVDVVLDGAVDPAKSQAAAAVSARAGGTCSVAMVSRDCNAIYDTGYFYDLYPSFEEVPEGVVITYHLLPNPILQSVEITGNSKAEPTDKLTKLVTVPTGQILNSRTLQENVSAIEQQYHTDGYVLAKISDLNINRDGHLTIKVSEGVLEGYNVKGNVKTKQKVILREMRTKVGEPLNKKDVTRSWQRLNNLGFFESVDIKPTPGVAPNAVVLELDVKEKRTGTFGIGAGYSTSDGFVGMVSVGDTNFRGTGDSISLMYEFSGDASDAHGYTFSYHHPWMDKKETAGTLRIYNRTYQYDDYDTNGNLTEEYMRKYSGGEIGFSRPISEYSTNYITIRNRNDNYDRHESGTDRSGALYEQWRHDNFGLTRSIILSHVTDTRDNIYYPTSGGRVSLEAEIAGFGGDFSYQKYTIEDQRYKKVGHAQVLAVRGKYGHSNSDLPESAEYKIGGQDSLRGYRDDQFRGNSVFLGTIEYRFPVISKVQGALFTDFGAAWYSGWNPQGMHESIGIGLQIQTPIGPIRLDYGHGSQGNRVHFSVGASF